MFVFFAAMQSGKLGRLRVFDYRTELTKNSCRFCSAPYRAGRETRELEKSKSKYSLEQMSSNLSRLNRHRRCYLSRNRTDHFVFVWITVVRKSQDFGHIPTASHSRMCWFYTDSKNLLYIGCQQRLLARWFCKERKSWRDSFCMPQKRITL